MTTSSSRPPFLTIRAEGAFLPIDILQRIVENAHEIGKLAIGKPYGAHIHVEPTYCPMCLGFIVIAEDLTIL